MTTLHHLDRPMYLLGYMAAQSRVFLVDRDFGVTSYALLLSIVEYKTLVMRGDFETAADVLETIPREHHNILAKFLEAKGEPERALEIATEDDYKFELSIALGLLEKASELASASDSEAKWRQLGEMAFSKGNMELSESCFNKSSDWSGLLMLYSAQGNADGIERLASLSQEHGKSNIAFACKYMLGDVHGCVDLLVACGRLPEAAFFARTYCPSRVTEIVGLWQSDLMKINPKAAESLANPDEYPNLFPGWQEALEKERSLGSHSPNAVAEMIGRGIGGINLNDSVEDTTAGEPVQFGSAYDSRDNEVFEAAADDVFEDAGEDPVVDEPIIDETPLAIDNLDAPEPAPTMPEEEVLPAYQEEEQTPEDEPVAVDASEEEEEHVEEFPVAAEEENNEQIIVDDDDDVLELTAEEEKLLEAELDGELDLDDDWGVDDDEF